MTDAFSRCHPVLNFFYFAVVLGFTMFIQHPVYLAVSFVAATAYSMWLNGVKKVLKNQFSSDATESPYRGTLKPDV